MTIAPIRPAETVGTACPPWCTSGHGPETIGNTCIGEIETIRLTPSIFDRDDDEPTIWAAIQQTPGEIANVAFEVDMAMNVLTAAEAEDLANTLHALAAQIRSAEANR